MFYMQIAEEVTAVALQLLLEKPIDDDYSRCHWSA